MKRDEKKADIENRILTAIIIDLDKKDLNEMSAEEIAARANVSKRTLYKYFASKKEMYLGVVKLCFRELAEMIAKQAQTMTSDDPFLVLECIGVNYLQYLLRNPVKGKVITSFNENDYVNEFPENVAEIARFSNTFELSAYISRFYQYHRATPAVSIESLSLYLWAHVQGLAALMLSKKSWIEDYYHIGFEELIKDHMKLSRQLLLGAMKES